MAEGAVALPGMAEGAVALPGMAEGAVALPGTAEDHNSGIACVGVKEPLLEMSDRSAEAAGKPASLLVEFD